MFQTNLLWQNDSRWANTPLGYGPQTIQQWGCLTTSLTMVVNGCGYNETPPTLIQKMVNIGGFNGPIINAYRIGDAFPGVALANLVECEGNAPLAQIDAELANNKPVVVRVDQSPAPGVQDHWVVLYAKSGNDYMMWDPWNYAGDAPGKAILLTSRYTNSGSFPAQAINSVIFFTISGKPTSAPAPATPTLTPQPAPATNLPIPANAVTVTTTMDALAFRGGPDMTAALLRRLALGTTLTALESTSAAQAKIGQTNQWLNVQAPEGDQGYVAAWYVVLASSLAPVPTPAPAPTPATTPTPTPVPASGPATGFTVKAIVDGTDFRTQPVTDRTTLIARVPIGTVFTVTDPNGAQTMTNPEAWLQVKDASKHAGYVPVRKVSR
jgi:hypothetical protein